jgi:hypothetical protein
MSQYLLSVHYVEGQAPPSPDVMERIFRQVDEVNDEMKTAGAWVFGGGLKPPTTATVVRAQNGELLVTDGPFPEAKEQLGSCALSSLSLSRVRVATSNACPTSPRARNP